MEVERYFAQNNNISNIFLYNSHSTSGYIHDMKILFTSWQQSGGITFREFKDIWKQLQFSYIHRGSAPNLDPAQFIQALFQVCIQFLMRHTEVNIRVACVYCLYCLYNTQVEPKQHIVQSIASWQEMLKVYNEMKEHKILDGILIWRKLKDEHCYIYSSSLPIDPFSPVNNTAAAPILSNPQTDINPDTLSGVVDMYALEDVASRYMQCKVSGSNSISPSEPPSLSVINPRLVDEIKTLLQHDRPQYDS